MLASGIVDVFAETALTGNPLAVVEGADAIPDGTLRRIAREFNQAETTFILRSSRADKKLRSFTANGSEVFGAGHNALGAWLWMAERGQLGALENPANLSPGNRLGRAADFARTARVANLWTNEAIAVETVGPVRRHPTSRRSPWPKR